MKAIVDTNVLIASIFWSGIPYKIVKYATEGKIELATSTEVLRELRKVLQDPQEKFALTEQETTEIIKNILNYVTVIEPNVSVMAVERDPDDNHVVACAVTAKADCIITRDHDLLSLRSYRNIQIKTPEEFFENLQTDST